MVGKCKICKKTAKTIYCSHRCHAISSVLKSDRGQITMYKSGKYSMHDIAKKIGLSYQLVSWHLKSAQKYGLIDKDKITKQRMCRLGADYFKTPPKFISRKDRALRAREISQMKKTMTFREIGYIMGFSPSRARVIYYAYKSGKFY